MNARLFQLHKIRRLICTQGYGFEFFLPGENEFGEPDGVSETHIVAGVYHETTSFLSKTSSDSTTIRQKPSPMILCLWEDVERLSHMMQLKYNGKLYRIGAIRNLSEANIVADISLEEVQDNGKDRVPI